MPYIIGIPRFLWKELKKIKSKAEILKETAVIDIAKEKLEFSGKLPDLPLQDFEPIYRCFQEIIEKKMMLQFSKKSSNNDTSSQSEYWELSSFELRKAFFMAYIKLMGDYLRFFDKDGKDFDYDGYLESVHYKKKSFFKEFIKTQNFISLVEKTSDCLKKGNKDFFFIKGIELYTTKGKVALEIELKKIFDHILYNHKNVF